MEYQWDEYEIYPLGIKMAGNPLSIELNSREIHLQLCVFPASHV